MCFGASESERATSMHHFASWANVVQTFWPVIRQPPSSLTALVLSEARSEPDSGSEKPWHQISSPEGSARGSAPSAARCRGRSRPGRPSLGPGRWRGAALGARQLLAEDRLLDQRRAAAAVLLGPRDAGPAGLVELPATRARTRTGPDRRRAAPCRDGFPQARRETRRGTPARTRSGSGPWARNLSRGASTGGWGPTPSAERQLDLLVGSSTPSLLSTWPILRSLAPLVVICRTSSTTPSGGSMVGSAAGVSVASGLSAASVARRPTRAEGRKASPALEPPPHVALRSATVRWCSTRLSPRAASRCASPDPAVHRPRRRARRIELLGPGQRTLELAEPVRAHRARNRLVLGSTLTARAGRRSRLRAAP